MVVQSEDKNQLENIILTYITQRAILASSTKEEDNKHFFYQNGSSILFPATTFDIANFVDLPVSTASDLLERMRRSKKIRTRLFQWFSRKIKLHIPYEMTWPEYLFYACKDCENWNRFTRECTFLQELYSKGFQLDILRVKKKITPKLTACKWLIKRNSRALHTFPTLQDFAEKVADISLWWNEEERDSHYLFLPIIPFQTYRCCFCNKPLPKFGWVCLPLVGSSIMTCDYCSSFFKLFYDKKSEAYGVIASEEKFHEYKRNYKIITGDDPEPNYFYEKYGLSLYDFDLEEELIIDIDTLSTANIFGFLCQIKFLAVRDKDLYYDLNEQLKVKHPHIDILLVDEPLVSIQPTKHQIGAAGTLRHTSVASYDYAFRLLWSRRYSLDELGDFASKRMIRESLETITKQILILQRKLRSKEQLTSVEWNRLDAKAAKEMWQIIKPIMEEHKFEMPNRFRSRHLEEVHLKPYGLYTSYSSGNTIVNGAFKKISDKYNEKCSELDFPWDGLEGICHKKTTGGVYGFSLDNQECFKTATIATTIESIVDERITPDMLLSTRLRKHMPIYFLKANLPAYEELTRNCDSILKKRILHENNGSEQETTIEKAMEHLIKNLKKLLNDVTWKDEVTVTVNGTKYCAWAVVANNMWKELSHKQKQRIINATRETYEQAKSYFQPFMYKPANSGGDFDLTFN